jgi:hypothetical protein
MTVPCLPDMRAGLLASALILSSALPAFAVCPVCNGSVRLDQSLAMCFQQRIDGELKRLQSEGRGFVIVDLSDCEDSRGGLPTDPKRSAELDASFVADDRGLRCLGDAIATHPGTLDPSVLFDLTKICL